MALILEKNPALFFLIELFHLSDCFRLKISNKIKIKKKNFVSKFFSMYILQEQNKMSGVGFEPTSPERRLRPERSALDHSAILTKFTLKNG